MVHSATSSRSSSDGSSGVGSLWNPLSWLGGSRRGALIGNSRTRDDVLADVWVNGDAQRAHERNQLCSLDNDGGGRVRICFRNRTPYPVRLCWVNENGRLHRFYRLDPCESSDVVDDKDDRKLLDDLTGKDDHIEQSFFGHAFVFGLMDEESIVDMDIDESDSDSEDGDDDDGPDRSEPRKLEKVLACYRPRSLTRSQRHSEDNDESDDDSEDSDDEFERAVHVVTLTEVPTTNPSRRFHGLRSLNCFAPKAHKDGTKEETEGAAISSPMSMSVKLSFRRGKVDPKPLDTSNKVYKETTLGGWPVRMEPGCFDDDPHLKKLYIRGLQYVSRKLPKHAREELQKNTPIYINKSLKYGPAAFPVEGRGMCFHPDPEWCTDMGMSAKKGECVEVYQADEYYDDCEQWGTGGVFLHELSHAYHWKCVKDQYENEDIMKCWELAMKDKLYDSVPVHGSQGPKARAYACTDQCEYFAELSTAFLGGLGKSEYNKWYPFNRQQIREHDPRAYQMLKRIWKVNE